MSSIGLNIVFSKPFSIESEQFKNRIKDFQPEFSEVKIDEKLNDGFYHSKISWGNHVVSVLIFGYPMPSEVLMACIDSATYDPSIKEEAKNHKAHALLHYMGSDASVMEQYIAMTSIAFCISNENALIIMNERARTSMPCSWFSHVNYDERMEFLRRIPVSFLYCGVVNYLDCQARRWSRTYGVEAFNLPNLAIPVDELKCEINPVIFFGDILPYHINNSKKLEIGHTSEYGKLHFVLRAPHKNEEALLDEEGSVLVFEPVRKTFLSRFRPFFRRILYR